MKKFISSFVLYYLRFFAKIQLLKNPKAKIIGVTGSAGKSSTINACQAAFGKKYRVKTTTGLNSESGIPLNILNIELSSYSPIQWLKVIVIAPIKLLTYWPHFDIFIVEMGIDAPQSPKNMSYLLSIIKPDYGIFLNVSSVHLQNFKNMDQIAHEKSLLLKNTEFSIANLHDPLVKKYSPPNSIPIIPIAIKFKKYLLPQIYESSFGAAVALANLFGISKIKAIKNIKKYFRLPPSRSSVFSGINQSTIIDSSYNSSPLAAIEMIKFLHEFKRIRICVLGDMRELGRLSVESHKKIYNFALKNSDYIISVGPETKKYFGSRAKKFDFWWQAVKYLKDNLPAKSAILVKGSQNTIFLEELVKSILQNKSDQKFLCRQSNYWQKLKLDFKKQNERKD